ncbi:MAG TPA: phage holin family protein [Micromonosporaceae bacterium]|nr:phage holin family protein [Micromonosporaceae bacterium]
MTEDDRGRVDAPAAPSTADLVRTAVEQITRLVRAEVRLAGAELAARAGRIARGGALAGASGVIGLYGLGGALATLGLVLVLVMPAWVAALIVSLVAFAAAALLALLGARQLRNVGSPVPERAADGVRADVQAVTDAVARRGRHRSPVAGPGDPP